VGFLFNSESREFLVFLPSPRALQSSAMQNRVRNVIFLGAGASKADDAPLQMELLREYFQPSRSSDEDRLAMDDELRKFFRAFYNIDTKCITIETTFPTFEEVLGTLELALARDENFRDPEGVWDRRRIQECREHVVFLICTVLAEKLGLEPSGGTNYHRKLVGKLPLDQSTCFISLNYDLLIDNALATSGRAIEYGTTFANPYEKVGEPVGLYKLHGSLNWLRCQLCNSWTYTGGLKMASLPPTKRTPCKTPECSGQTVPIVIPPTFFKVTADFHLQQVWHDAERELVQAKRIIFCGYSLPDADMHIRYLLKRAEVNRGSTPDVFVFNDHPDKTPRESEEEAARYQRLFREKSRVVYTDLSFQDFADRGLEILDYI
jgi:hypothetical protein